MSAEFIKVYASIIRSTVWQTPPHVKLTWLTMLIIADAEGRVEATIPGLAATAGVTIPQCEEALRCFLSPDPYSRTKTEGGVRIRAFDGGWDIINHAIYRERRTRKQMADAERIAAKRAAERATCRSVAADLDLDLDGEEEEDRSSGSASPEQDTRVAFDASEGKTSAEPKASEPKDGARAPGKKLKVKSETDPNVLAVFEHWRTKLHPKAQLDNPRAKAVRKQLDAGRTVADLIRAVDGCASSAWHVGNNQTDLELICRDAKHVESFLAKADAPRTAAGARAQSGSAPPRRYGSAQRDNGIDGFSFHRSHQ